MVKDRPRPFRDLQVRGPRGHLGGQMGGRVNGRAGEQ